MILSFVLATLIRTEIQGSMLKIKLSGTNKGIKKQSFCVNYFSKNYNSPLNLPKQCSGSRFCNEVNKFTLFCQIFVGFP